MRIRKITTISIIIIICAAAFIFPFIKATEFSYAETSSVPSGYSPVTDDMELAQAFNDYCKSRDAEFTSSMPGATYTYIYNYMKEGLGYLGYNIDELQEGLFKQVEDNSIARWYLNSTSMGMFNELFAYLINENDLEIGDSANASMYSGDYIDGAFVYYYYRNTSTDVTKLGTPYIYTADDLNSFNSNSTFTVNLYGNSYPFEIQIKNFTSPNQRQIVVKSNTSSISNYSSVYYPDSNTYSYYSNFGIGKATSTGRYYLGLYYCGPTTSSTRYNQFSQLQEITFGNNAPVNVEIIFTTNNNVINNNIHEGDIIITNEGNVINEGDTNINYNPYPDGGGTVTPPSSGNGGGGSDGTITFPDLDFNFPQINWSLGDLSEKFPFSIPFDLIAFFTVLNAEPEAPFIDANIPLGDWYTWHFEADFSQFDNWAAIIRNVEFIAFCVGLIYLTIRLVKG